MDFDEFFDYPEGSEQKGRAGDLVFLADLDEEDWATLFEHTTERSFRAGEVVIQLGDVDRSVHIVRSGTLEVLVPRRRGALERVAVIEPGSIFGEQSFFDGKPRSATVRALDETHLLTLDREAFDVLAAREPELSRAVLFDLARILSLRLRQTTALLVELTR
jgi:CRP-like cAMP-binding protein